MKSVFKNHSLKEKIITQKFPKNLKTNVLKEETIAMYSANGSTREILLDGIKINIRNGVLKPPLIIDVEHDFPFLKMHFEIEGSSEYTPKNNKSVAVIIPNGHYIFFFLPKVKGTLTYSSTTRRTLEIIFTKAYLKRVFGQSFKDVSSGFGDALEKDIPFLMWEQSKPITPQLHTIIEDVVNCKFKGAIKKAYLESKITEMLTIFFDSLKNRSTKKNRTIHKDDYMKILYAETIIRKNIKHGRTISELSTLTGINTFKLKQNFKLVFGNPIFSYLTELRMKKAKELISEKGYTVAEAAYEIGYKNPQHFTIAFKKKYNYLPRALKQ